jgi:hypothetical protein
MYLKGNDGPKLLKAIHAIWDEDYVKANELLRSPEVVANSTAGFGGKNDLEVILRAMYLPGILKDEAVLASGYLS